MSKVPTLGNAQCAEVLVRTLQRCLAGKAPDDQLLLWIDAVVGNHNPTRDRDWVERMMRDEMTRDDTPAPSGLSWVSDGWRDAQPKKSSTLLSRSVGAGTLPKGDDADEQEPVLSKRYVPDRPSSRRTVSSPSVEPVGSVS